MKWNFINFDSEMENGIIRNYPKVSGKYLVIIEGEKIYDDAGYQIDGYDSYESVMTINVGKNEITGDGLLDETLDRVLAWIGPIPPIPEEVK